MFEGLMGNDSGSEAMDMIKVLYDRDNIEMITDLNINQIRGIMALYWSKLRRNKQLSYDEKVDLLTGYYLKLLVSIKRKGRAEGENILKGIVSKVMEFSLADKFNQGA